MKNKLIRWTEEESEYLIKLYKDRCSYSLMVQNINHKFNTNRTTSSLEGRLKKLGVLSHSNRISVFTIKADEIILENITKYPDNYQQSFDVSVRDLSFINIKVTKDQVSNRFYKVLKKKKSVATVGSSKGFTTNNVKNRHKRVQAEPQLKPLLWLITEISKLTHKERELLIKVLNN